MRRGTAPESSGGKGRASAAAAGVGAAAASGALVALAFPKFGLAWLAWIALVPLILAARAASPRGAALLGLAAGVTYFAVLLEWIRIFDSTGWVLLAFWQGAYVALFALLIRLLAPSPSGWRAVLVPAAAWAALEWVRSLTRGGFTWGDLAYALHGSLALVQLVSLAGPLGLSFLVALVNASVASLVGAAAGREADAGERRAAAVRLALAAGLVLAGWGWGRHRLAQPLPQGPKLRVALLQGNVSGEGRDEPISREKLEQTVRTYLQMTDEAAQSKPDVIFWPETAVPDYLLQNESVLRRIQATAARLRVNLVVGASHEDEEGRLYNSAFLFDREGRLAGRYDKVHLVPYGEYTPLRRQLAFLYRYFPVRAIDYTSGRGFVPLRTDAGSIGVAICFESAFPRISRTLRAAGADVLAITTNDAWFGYRAATWEHYQMAAYRAVENGSYVLRTATTGFSAIVDPRGRVIAGETPLFERRILVGDVQRLPGRTLYERIGDAAGWGSALAVLALLLLRRRR